MTDAPDWSQPASTADITGLSNKLDTVIANTGFLTGALVDSAVSITTSRAVLFTASGRQGLIVTNNSTTATLWVGGAGVAANLGTPIPPGVSYGFGLNGNTLYAVASAGSITVTMTSGTVS